MKAILEASGKLFYKNDFLKALEQIGIQNGDTICVHTELFTLGKPLLPKDEFLGILLECFYEIIGASGTLIMPTFTYSFCKGEVYDKLHSRSTMGVLTDFFRTQDGVVRTNDPIFSFAIGGANISEFLTDTTSCFEINSVYDKLRKKDGKIVLLGTQKAGYTFTHYIEEQAKIGYRYYKKFSGIMKDESGNTKTKNIMYHVRDVDKRSILSVEKQVLVLKNSNNFCEIKFGNSTLTSINTKKYFDECMRLINLDQNILLE